MSVSLGVFADIAVAPPTSVALAGNLVSPAAGDTTGRCAVLVMGVAGVAVVVGRATGAVETAAGTVGAIGTGVGGAGIAPPLWFIAIMAAHRAGK